MTPYDDEQRAQDNAQLEDALRQLDEIREAYSDVVAIPEIITIQDVCSIALDTTKGPQQVGDVCSREEIVAILRAIEDNPCGDIALIAQLELNEYRQTHKTKEN